ncbi:MAG: hypothetical protein WAV96_01945 [Trichococcus flocculiformis]|jgi:hypothetical protein
MTQDMIKYNIFFDESEVKSLRVNMDISLMGCLRIPESLYNTPKIQSLTAKLRNGSLKLHFAEYKQSHLKKFPRKYCLVTYMLNISQQWR